MRMSTVALACTLFIMGCSDRPLGTPLEPTIEHQTSYSFVWPEDRYPTEDEFATHGGESSVTITTPQTTWYGTSAFGATAQLTATWINEATGALEVQLIDGNGNTINSSMDPVSFAQYRPEVTFSRPLSAQASTVNRTCGLTGKASASGSAALHLLRVQFGDLQPFLLWSAGYGASAPDSDLPACTYEEGFVIWESGEDCGDPSSEYCQGPGGGGYPPMPGGGSGGGSGGNICTLWEYTVYESGDGGQTWVEQYQYYVWECY